MSAVDKPWQLKAACRDADPALFFGRDGEPSRGNERDDRIAAAKKVCARCSVTSECAEFVFVTPAIHHGVWAGMDDDEHRTAGLRHRRRVAAEQRRASR